MDDSRPTRLRAMRSGVNTSLPVQRNRPKSPKTGNKEAVLVDLTDSPLGKKVASPESPIKNEVLKVDIAIEYLMFK